MSQSPVTRYLRDIHTVVPKKSWAQTYAAERFTFTCRDPRSHRLLRRIGRQSGIDRRYLAALEWQDRDDAPDFYMPIEEQPSGPGMGQRSERFDIASNELTQAALAEIPREELRQTRSLITVSCTHASAPGLERPLFEHAPHLSRRVSRWNLGFMGCSAGLAALRLVHGLPDDQASALICTCELSSLHFQYSDAVDQMTANMLFADGLALVRTTADPTDVAILGAESAHLPEHSAQMIWFGADHGLRLTLARDLADTLAEHLRAATEAFLATHDLTLGDIDVWAVHPGGPQILQAVEETLALPDDALAASREVLRDYGNMSSSTIFFILQRLRTQAARGKCLAIAFGPGLTIEFVLLEFNPAAASVG